MPTMTIRVTNASFESVAPGEYDTLDEAFNAALVAGTEIAANEVFGGAQGTIVRVAVDLVGMRGAAQGAVAITTARFVDGAGADV